MAEEDGVGMNNEEVGTDSEENDEAGESDDSFIDDDEILGRRSNFLESKQLEIEENKQKILSHLDSLSTDQFERIGLIFAYSNKADLFK